jgi:hypothetical protein
MRRRGGNSGGPFGKAFRSVTWEEQAEILVKVGVYMYDLGPDGAGPQSVVRRRVLSQRITPTSDRVRVLRQVHKAAACNKQPRPSLAPRGR